MQTLIRFLTLVIAFALFSCIETVDTYSKIAPGIWRATLNLDKGSLLNESDIVYDREANINEKEINATELPFNFEVLYDENDDLYVNIINGKEKIRVDEIYFGRDMKTAKDTILINFSIYDSYIKAIVEERVMEGNWHVKNRNNYSIPFVARHGQDYRFSQLKKKPKLDLSGKWECTFEVDTEDEYKAIGEFVQDGNHLEGTFITETGDYRFLQGTVQNEKVYLSVFDGAHAFLFEARILEDESLVGIFRSGKHYKTTWTGVRNKEFRLKDPNTLTYLKEGFQKIEFNLPNPDGKLISLDDDNYRGKPTIIQILGSWCPNCRDETRFLTEYLKNEAPEDLRVIGISFEKHKDPDKAKKAIRNYITKMKVPYEIVWGGSSDKSEAVKTLPMLNEIISYPTMIFMDADGVVKKIHTGFSGPATSLYDEFKKEFLENIKLITNSE